MLNRGDALGQALEDLAALGTDRDRFGDGHEEKYPLAALGDLVTERGNPRNRRSIALTVATADAWRQRQRERIEPGLANTDARLAANLQSELEVLRESAAELLGLDLAEPEPGGRLAEDQRFFYTAGQGMP